MKRQSVRQAQRHTGFLKEKCSEVLRTTAEQQQFVDLQQTALSQRILEDRDKIISAANARATVLLQQLETATTDAQRRIQSVRSQAEALHGKFVLAEEEAGRMLKMSDYNFVELTEAAFQAGESTGEVSPLAHSSLWMSYSALKISQAQACVNDFGEIASGPELKWLSPSNQCQQFSLSADGKTLTSTGFGMTNFAVTAQDLPTYGITRFSIKIQNNERFTGYIGIVESSYIEGLSSRTHLWGECGWYLARDGKLWATPPGVDSTDYASGRKVCARAYADVVKGLVTVEVDNVAHTISFAFDGVSKGVAFSDIPSRPLRPIVLLGGADSVVLSQ
eukprot:TRINITY_DN6001_c0_g1_i1.p1 TRINITY_DN6001_c0_g1~~TRINITY_DN6001_c0_g1_i1.p1  ORF type:complete len:334 (+),score=52.99 TRINITY_DN6001_c0_g1_i1:789-1790(+)